MSELPHRDRDAAPADYDLVVIGGGAAGFFGAIHAGLAAPGARVVILEQAARTLQKVRISGGGRCNVTHAEFDPRQLVTHYPRGRRELRGPFSRYAPGDTMDYFERRGVALKIESDNRVFPASDDSADIAAALERHARELGVAVRTRCKVTGVKLTPEGFSVGLSKAGSLTAKHVLLATGSTPSAWSWVARLGIRLVDAVPSLFSLNVPEPALHGLKGLSVSDATVAFPREGIRTRGPLLITHWGLSGPAALRASAEGALALHASGYETSFRVSWTGHTRAEMQDYLRATRHQAGGQRVTFPLGLPLPRRLWAFVLSRAGLDPAAQWANLGKRQLGALATELTEGEFAMRGKTRFKDEFVTAGGIDLREVDFATFGLRSVPGAYAAGELLNIDGVTGGFNFQAAWTGGYLAGTAIGEALRQNR